MSKIPLEDIGGEFENAIKSPAKLPPVESWNPPLSGDIDIVITRDGVWHHEGSPIKRQPLVKLFSSILKREGDDYFLVTPVEKWRMQVEDVPFLVVAMECSSNDVDAEQVLTFTTNVDDRVCAGPDNPIRVEVDPETDEPSPYLLIRRNLEGRISRSVYYQLAELAKPITGGEAYGESCTESYGVSSCGVSFELK
ncbi:MAG: DUF1285 domain-containing protein [Porticoccaceae bacterium]